MGGLFSNVCLHVLQASVEVHPVFEGDILQAVENLAVHEAVGQRDPEARCLEWAFGPCRPHFRLRTLPIMGVNWL